MEALLFYSCIVWNMWPPWLLQKEKGDLESQILALFSMKVTCSFTYNMLARTSNMAPLNCKVSGELWGGGGEAGGGSRGGGGGLGYSFSYK